MTKAKKNVSEVILKAAYESIAEKGYANISLRDIAKEAGVALSQLHYYFGSKQALFKEIILQMKSQYIDAFIREIQGMEETDDKMTALVTLFQKILSQDPGLMRIFFDLYSLSLWSEEFRQLLSSLMDELSLLVEEELLSDSHPFDTLHGASRTDVAKLLIGTVFGIAMQYTINPDDNHQLIESLHIVPKIL